MKKRSRKKTNSQLHSTATTQHRKSLHIPEIGKVGMYLHCTYTHQFTKTAHIVEERARAGDDSSQTEHIKAEQESISQNSQDSTTMLMDTGALLCECVRFFATLCAFCSVTIACESWKHIYHTYIRRWFDAVKIRWKIFKCVYIYR